LLWVSQQVVNWHAGIEPAWRIATPPLWLAVAISVSLVAAALPSRPLWRIAWTVLVVLWVGLMLWHPFAPSVSAGQLEMTVIDVGQGDSILLNFPGGRRMLIDGGGIPAFGRQARSQLDIGEDVVAPYLWDRGIRRLDVIALSHAHDDHIGGLPSLIAAFRPRELWTGATPDSPSWREVCRAAARFGVRIVPRSAPQHIDYSGAGIEVLAPFSDYLPADVPKNNDSLVLRVGFGRHRFLLTGDIEKQVERRMLEENELDPADVLKVAHHGSKTSSTEELLDRVHPVFALISAGFENSYGHPHRDVTERLSGHHAAVLRTDRDGLISIHSDGRRLTVESYSGFFSQR